MIKLGKLTKSALNKEFPDRWKSIATMLRLPWEMYDNNKTISIELSDIVSVDIKEDNSFTSNAEIPSELVAQLLMAAVQSSKKEK